MWCLYFNRFVFCDLQMLNLILNWVLWTWSHWPDKNHLEANILHAFWGGGAEVTYYWSDQRGIMVILRRARPPASAPTSNESWLALAGFVSNQLSGGQFNEEKLSSQPARNTACKLQQREFYILVECFKKKKPPCVWIIDFCPYTLLDCQSSRSWGR